MHSRGVNKTYEHFTDTAAGRNHFVSHLVWILHQNRLEKARESFQFRHITVIHMKHKQVVHGKTPIQLSSTSWQIYLHDKCQCWWVSTQRPVLTCDGCTLKKVSTVKSTTLIFFETTKRNLSALCQIYTRVPIKSQSHKSSKLKCWKVLISESCNWLLGCGGASSRLI